MGVVVTGGGFLTTSSWGTRKDRLSFHPTSKKAVFPDLKTLSIKRPSRWGRFDRFTRMGFVAASLALQDAVYVHDGNKVTGMVISSFYGTVNTDRSYYETTLEEDGAFSSPNLFSYTLPVVLVGECSTLYQFSGPAFCTGDDPLNRGVWGIKIGLDFIESGMADQMLVGVVEDPPEESDASPVSIFVFLERENRAAKQRQSIVTRNHEKLVNEKNQRVRSILELFPLKDK